MRNHQSISSDELSKLELQFKKSVQLVKHIWGKNGFNIYSIDSATKQGAWSRQFNQGLFQIVMYWFIPYEKQQVIPHSDLLREELINLQVHDPDFFHLLTGSGTNIPTKVRKKFDVWGTTVKGILNYPVSEPRSFTLERKQTLWKADRPCELCGQRIATIDDAEVDHITCYWKGGKTIPENSRLTHRYCNRHRRRG